MKDKIEVSAVHLSTVGDVVLVAVEVDGQWHQVISERKDNAYSHIWEAHALPDAAVAEKREPRMVDGAMAWLSDIARGGDADARDYALALMNLIYKFVPRSLQVRAFMRGEIGRGANQNQKGRGGVSAKT